MSDFLCVVAYGIPEGAFTLAQREMQTEEISNFFVKTMTELLY